MPLSQVLRLKGTMSALTELFEQIRNCHKCDIARSRTLAVPGEGPDNAEIMFIGEAPGFNEDQQGRPFVGQAGQFLNELIASIGLRREDVYITNIVKTRPPGNRDPLPQEIQNCGAWLDRQLDIIRPRMVVTLGRYSMARFFPGKSISQIHGTSVSKDGVLYFAMYHPAAALHQQSLRQTLKQDMLKIPALLAIEKAPPAPQPAQTKQLHLF
jgi:uracil-DNA glycosylase family 4